ncbi:hypothetical protein HDU93_009873 [Gonapodya sp. JEL0774]|nr:hypothetical protein HDU93_009873 [Gonapodya sp. JEL0774]
MDPFISDIPETGASRNSNLAVENMSNASVPQSGVRSASALFALGQYEDEDSIMDDFVDGNEEAQDRRDSSGLSIDVSQVDFDIVDSVAQRDDASSSSGLLSQLLMAGGGDVMSFQHTAFSAGVPLNTGEMSNNPGFLPNNSEGTHALVSVINGADNLDPSVSTMLGLTPTSDPLNLGEIPSITGATAHGAGSSQIAMLLDSASRASIWDQAVSLAVTETNNGELCIGLWTVDADLEVGHLEPRRSSPMLPMSSVMSAEDTLLDVLLTSHDLLIYSSASSSTSGMNESCIFTAFTLVDELDNDPNEGEEVGSIAVDGNVGDKRWWRTRWRWGGLEVVLKLFIHTYPNFVDQTIESIHFNLRRVSAASHDNANPVSLARYPYFAELHGWENLSLGLQMALYRYNCVVNLLYRYLSSRLGDLMSADFDPRLLPERNLQSSISLVTAKLLEVSHAFTAGFVNNVNAFLFLGGYQFT